MTDKTIIRPEPLQIDRRFDARLLIGVAPQGYLRRVS
jgi:cephalosporin hydroxylase